jgi:predicted DNA-binding protein
MYIIIERFIYFVICYNTYIVKLVKNREKILSMSVQIRITVSKEIDSLLSQVAQRLGKKKSMLSRELMEQKLYDLEIIQKKLAELK